MAKGNSCRAMNCRQTRLSCREFLKASAFTLPLAAAAPLPAGTPGEPTTKTTAALRIYFDKGKQLSISMWDFLWLMAHHPSGAYEDLERRVAEAAERGYNTLRGGCFP